MHSFSISSWLLTGLVTCGIGACASVDHSVGSHSQPVDGDGTVPDGGPGGGGKTDGGGQTLDGGSTEGGGGAATCNGVPNPAGCSAQNPCDSDEECVPNTGSGCISSGCACDSSSNNWSCTPDCGGHVCVPKTATCNGVANPAGCSTQNPCPSGKTCVANDTAACISSGCACDSGSNTWVCTPDCGGQICK